MKIPAIKKLVETYSITELQQAEVDITEEQKPKIEVEGEDEGEQLTHLYGALWIKEIMEKEGLVFTKALRMFTEKVRNSIN